MKKFCIVALCLVMALTLAACGESPAPVNPDESSNTTTTTTAADNAPGEDVTTTTTLPDGNVVDGDSFFGTTTTTQKDAPTTTTKKGDTTTTTTTTTKKPVTTTTIAPPVQVEIGNVKVPAANYDMDGKKRIVVKASEVKEENGKRMAYFTFANVSKDNGREWIIPEYSKIKYACYDKNGKEIHTGEFVLGALEYGKTVVCSVEMPATAAELKFTGHNLEYWTPWG